MKTPLQQKPSENGTEPSELRRLGFIPRFRHENENDKNGVAYKIVTMKSKRCFILDMVEIINKFHVHTPSKILSGVLCATNIASTIKICFLSAPVITGSWTNWTGAHPTSSHVAIHSCQARCSEAHGTYFFRAPHAFSESTCSWPCFFFDIVLIDFFTPETNFATKNFPQFLWRQSDIYKGFHRIHIGPLMVNISISKTCPKFAKAKQEE